ncbi:Tubulin/FtsZ family, GTPase domain-containing protein [Tribonema minus]|uniref:Tubulin/FtsZ family, GTPase domain-containing protein n=1 Tax=Tribonema minus TaxID=303371 RepID=A0A835Z0A6_9STRA|nr:Tubulin/FtsZ family, GTPase domain-containing protein [Tribonema minus]
MLALPLHMFGIVAVEPTQRLMTSRQLLLRPIPTTSTAAAAAAASALRTPIIIAAPITVAQNPSALQPPCANDSSCYSLDRLSRWLDTLCMVHSSSGGTGSGLGCALLQALRDEYPKPYVISVCAAGFACDSPLQHYNTAFTLQYLAEYADAVLYRRNQDQLIRATRAPPPPSPSPTTSARPRHPPPPQQPQQRPDAKADISIAAMNAGFARDVAGYFMSPSSPAPPPPPPPGGSSSSSSAVCAAPGGSGSSAAQRMLDGGRIAANACPFRRAKFADVYTAAAPLDPYERCGGGGGSGGGSADWAAASRLAAQIGHWVARDVGGGGRGRAAAWRSIAAHAVATGVSVAPAQQRCSSKRGESRVRHRACRSSWLSAAADGIHMTLQPLHPKFTACALQLNGNLAANLMQYHSRVSSNGPVSRRRSAAAVPSGDGAAAAAAALRAQLCKALHAPPAALVLDTAPSQAPAFLGGGHSVSVCCNSTPVADSIAYTLARAQEMYEAGAYRHWYARHGIEAEDFMAAFEGVQSIVDEYDGFGT